MTQLDSVTLTTQSYKYQSYCNYSPLTGAKRKHKHNHDDIIYGADHKTVMAQPSLSVYGPTWWNISDSHPLKTTQNK